MDALDYVPAPLRDAAATALTWVNEQQGTDFSLTGLVDPGVALATPQGEPFELGLVLCEQDRCARQDVRIIPEGAGFRVEPAAASTDSGEIPPELDPPAGDRVGWLDRTVDAHAFLVLVFYRGFW